MILWEDIRSFQYAETATVVLIIVASVTLPDVLSQRLRRLFI